MQKSRHFCSRKLPSGEAENTVNVYTSSNRFVRNFHGKLSADIKVTFAEISKLVCDCVHPIFIKIDRR